MRYDKFAYVLQIFRGSLQNKTPLLRKRGRVGNVFINAVSCAMRRVRMLRFRFAGNPAETKYHRLKKTVESGTFAGTPISLKKAEAFLSEKQHNRTVLCCQTGYYNSDLL